MLTFHKTGIVNLDENDLNRMNYILNTNDGQRFSLTDMLDTIYNSKNSIKKLVRICGKICCNGHNFHCFEGLHIQDNKKGIPGYFVGNFPISDQMFEFVGSEIEILIEDYTDSIGEFITDINNTIIDAMEEVHNEATTVKAS